MQRRSDYICLSSPNSTYEYKYKRPPPSPPLHPLTQTFCLYILFLSSVTISVWFGVKHGAYTESQTNLGNARILRFLAGRHRINLLIGHVVWYSPKRCVFPGGGLVGWQLAGINYIIRGGEGHRRLHTQHPVKAKYSQSFVLFLSILIAVECTHVPRRPYFFNYNC